MNDYDDLADLDEVFGPLRSAAKPAELSQQDRTVDLMVRAHRTAEGKHMFTSRRARIATLVAAGVLGFGGMAAASPDFGDKPPVEAPPVVTPPLAAPPIGDDPTEPVESDDVDDVDDSQPAEEDQPVLAVVQQPVIAEAPEEVPAVDDDPDKDTAFNEAYCVPEANHGKTVSAVARRDSDFLEKYQEGNGELPTVTDAAHSSCGKHDDDVDGTDEEIDDSEFETETETEDEFQSETESDDDSEKSEAKAERPGRGAENGKANGRSNGHGNGNGKRGG